MTGVFEVGVALDCVQRTRRRLAPGVGVRVDEYNF